MSKAVMLSIRPKWVEKIASGEKTIEVRKTRPKLETPFKCYIYCTRGGVVPSAQKKQHGKVIGEFTCDAITRVNICGFWDDSGKQLDNRLKDTCLTSEEFRNYLGENVGYGWHITDLRIYDAPKCLFEFWAERLCNREPSAFGCGECCDCDKRPPQSWCYVEEMKNV